MCLKDYFSSKTHTYCTVKKGGLENFGRSTGIFFFAGHIYGNIFLSIMVLGEPIFSAVVISRNLVLYQSSPSFSLAGTSMPLGLSMILAVRCPFSTIPIIQAWYPSCFSMSLQYAAACSRGKQIKRPPEVSAE